MPRSDSLPARPRDKEVRQQVTTKRSAGESTSLPPPRLLVKRLYESARLPKRSTDGAIGLDLYAHLLLPDGRPNTILIGPRVTRQVPTGLVVVAAPGAGVEVFVYSRSSLGAQGVLIANAPGVIDPDYRGELLVLLHNAGFQSYYVKHGDRIAQLLMLPVVVPAIEEVEELDDTPRGEGGIGSTGR